MASGCIAWPIRRDRRVRLAELRTGDGGTLPPRLGAEIGRALTRLELVLAMIGEIEAERDAIAAAQAAAPPHPGAAKIHSLAQLTGIGPEFATVLVGEVFHRAFDNRRQVASYVGLAPRPFCSGGLAREQGISKAGNPKARTTMPVLGPAEPDPGDRARLDVAAPSAEQRFEHLVPRAGRRPPGAAAPDRCCRARAQAAGRLVALPRERLGAHRRHP